MGAQEAMRILRSFSMREAVTLIVNSPFQAEPSAGADLSHAQLGVRMGGREAASTAPCSPFSRCFL